MPKPRGTKPVPNELKRKRGNPGHRPMPGEGELPKLPRAAGIPEPPRPLGRPGREMWDRMWEGGAVWMSPATDLDAVLRVCERQDEHAILRRQVIEHGRRLDRVQLRALDKQIDDQLSELGFTPLARTRAGLAEVGDATTDELGEILQMVTDHVGD